MLVYSQRRFLVGWLLALAAIVTLVLPPVVTYANGRVIQFERRIAGPYEIAVGTIPQSLVIGSLHLTMSISDAATDTFILNTEVTVTGKGPESDAIEIGPLAAQINPNDPAFHDVNTSVDRVGVWSFVISVSGDLGDASAEFPIEVKNSSPLIGIATLAALLGFVIVLGFSIRAYLRERGKSKSQD